MPGCMGGGVGGGWGDDPNIRKGDRNCTVETLMSRTSLIHYHFIDPKTSRLGFRVFRFLGFQVLEFSGFFCGFLRLGFTCQPSSISPAIISICLLSLNGLLLLGAH